MLVLGHGALLVALVAAAWAFLAGLLGGVNRSGALTRSAGRGIVASCALLSLAMIALAHALLTNDFRVEYVAEYSSRNQPLAYKISALWAGQAGSLLCWAFLLAVFGAVFVALRRRIPADLHGWSYTVLGATTLFFTLVTALVANPFKVFPNGMFVMDGNGMNPLLQNFWMIIHPPTLYIGYVGATVPFALAVAALLAGRLDQTWVRAARSWTLFAFAFLTLGIWLGGYWAYIELGWGGFWAWDPVENASLMPWLAMTAFVHSLIAQERRGVLKVWNLVLVAVTFLLTIYGTFLTRSGIIQSVHAFGKSSIGNWFLAFILVAGAVALGALIYRLKGLRPDARMDALLSREASFLFGNLVFVGITIMVFLLTMWPVISEVTSGTQVTFKPEQFTAATRPFFLLAVLLMAVAPLLAWRGSSGRQVGRAMIAPAVAALAGIALLALLGAREPWSLGSFGAGIFATVAIVTDIGRLVGARRELTKEPLMTAFFRTLGQQRRRFGGYASHVSVVLMLVGIAASMAYQKVEHFEALTPGQNVSVDGYGLTYQGFDLTDGPTYEGARIRLAVVRPGSGSQVNVLPEMRRYGLGRPMDQRQPSTEVAILSTLLPGSIGDLARIGEDLYVIPHSVDLNTGVASIEVIIHPLVNWLWLGGVLLLFGTLLAYWPERPQPEPSPALAAAPARAALPGAAR